MNAPADVKAGLTELPRFVQIEPVGQCNLRCRMCPIQFRTDGTPDHPPAFMSYDTFCSIVSQFPAMTELHLQGMGEPLMHPRFFDMVSYAAARGIEVSTNSNLTLLSERRALECVKSGLARIHVSLDGATAGTYGHIRVRAKFDRVVRNIRRLIAAKAELKSELPAVHLVAVAMRRNLSELPDIVRLARELGIDVLSVQHLCHDFGEADLPAQYRPMRSFVEGETLLNEDPSLVERVFAEARSEATRLGVSLRLPNVRPRPHSASTGGRARCDWPWRGAYLSYAGDAMPCCMVATPDRINFGNVADEGVVHVWNNAAYRRFREDLESGEPPAVCRSCAVYTGTF
jgi:radical SAM protein with 4Fe4S-binding SPASM domain